MQFACPQAGSVTIGHLELLIDPLEVRFHGIETNDEFLCLIQKEREKEPSLYRMPLSGKNPKLLVKHARTPSASAPQSSQSSGQ